MKTAEAYKVLNELRAGRMWSMVAERMQTWDWTKADADDEYCVLLDCLVEAARCDEKVTPTMRVLPDVDASVAYAEMVGVFAAIALVAIRNRLAYLGIDALYLSNTATMRNGFKG